MMVEWDVVRSGRRSICLEVTPEARLIIRAPWDVSERQLRAIVLKRGDWIERSLQGMRRRNPKPTRAFCDGETLPFLGKEYPLRIVEFGGGQPLEFREVFLLERRYVCMARRLLTAWYRSRALVLFRERLRRWEGETGFRAAGMVLSDARSRWGCCTPAGVISLSWRLCMAPLEVVDYVIVHELAHVVQRDHSARFWKLLSRLFPGYREQRGWLKNNGHTLAV